MDETANVPSGEHVWLAPGEYPNTSLKWTCCRLCGVVQRTDGRPQSRCKGLVKVALRSQTNGSSGEQT